MRRPDFLVIGAARSGTTALTRSLSQHPKLQMTEPKETHFFAHVGTDISYNGPGDDVMMNDHLIRTSTTFFARYGAEKKTPGTLLGEGSVSTLAFPDRSIPAIVEFADPEVRLIAMLRSPAQRAYSSYLYLRARGHETAETFLEGLALEDERTAAGFHHMWQYRSLSRYSEQLPAFIETFGDRLLVLIFEEYRDNPVACLRRICEHLGVDASFSFETGGEVNRGGEPKSQTFTYVMNMIRRSPFQSLAKTIVPAAVRERIRAVNLGHPEAEHSLMASLRKEFLPDVEVVETLLGRTVNSWK